MHQYPIGQALGVQLPTVEVFDVGAMIEGAERYAGLVAQGLAQVTGFEPNPQEYQRLCATHVGPYRYFPYFLGNGGPAQFHVARYPGCSSLYAPNAALIDLFTSLGTQDEADNFRVVAQEQVQTTRLDDIPEIGLPDFVKMDIQGSELDVLRGATQALSNAVVFELETMFVPLYHDQPLFGDLQVFMRKHGFLFHKFIDISGRSLKPFMPSNNPFTPISQALWADAIFVRDFTALESFSDEQLLKAAMVLHELYCSYDLVYHFLKEYDRRRNVALAGQYAQAVLSHPDLPMMYMTFKLHP